MFVSNGGCHAKRLKGLSEIHNEIHSGICPSVPGPGAHCREDLSATAQRNQGRGTGGSDRLRRLRVPLSRCQRPTCNPRWAEKRAVARRKRGPPRGPNPSKGHDYKLPRAMLVPTEGGLHEHQALMRNTRLLTPKVEWRPACGKAYRQSHIAGREPRRCRQWRWSRRFGQLVG